MNNKFVEQYAGENIKIFACYPDKAPATPNGFKDATFDLELLQQQFPDGTDRAIGLATGGINGIIVVDIDVNKPMELNGKKIEPEQIDPRSVDELKSELEDFLGIELPDTVEIETQHGGRHYYYTVSADCALASSRRSFDPSLPIDIRANGGYVCTVDGTARYTVYDDVDDMGIIDLRDRCAACPPEILNFKKHTFYENTIVQNYEKPPMELSEITQLRAALAYIPADDRDVWVNYGMAMKHMGGGDFLKPEWVMWSMRSPKYDPRDIDERWAKLKPRGDIKFGTIIKHAQSLGFISTYIHPEDISIVTMSEEKIAERMERVVRNRAPFPVDLLRPDGFMGDVIDYMNSQAVKDQPILALAGTLAFTGMVLGRKVEGDTGIRTNLYIVGLGETGCGKDNVRACIKRIMQSYDKVKFHSTCSVSDVTSDSAVYRALEASISQLFLIDEMGMFLKTTTNAGANPYLYGIQKAFLTLFSDCNQITFGKTYADSKNNIELNNPHLCIYGNANPKQFYDSLTTDNISDGLVSRFLFFESENIDPPKNKIKRSPVPAHIISQLDHLWKMPTNIQPSGNIDTTVMPLIVPKNATAEKMLDEFDAEIRIYREALRSQKRIDVTYNRAGLSAEKLAIIYAVTEDVFNPTPIITEKHMSWAIRVVRYLMDQMQYAVEFHVWESEHERHTKKIMQIICEKGAASITDIALQTQYLDNKKRDDILATLLTCQLIQEEFTDPEPGQQKSKKIFLPKIKEGTTTNEKNMD